jgi:protein gp37
MGEQSNIDWTDSTWNPVRGCTKVSPGCKFCYAETFSERFRGVPGHAFEHGFDLQLIPKKLEEPLRWKAPRRVFVNSMSDLFHEDIPTDYIVEVFQMMEEANWHTYQILTKRSERLLELKDKLSWPANVWMGVSVESKDYTYRVRDLQKVPAAIRFVSAEPLLGPISRLPLKGIHWVIVGGESGRHARPMELAWARSIREQCEKSGVSFFLKQLGGRQSKRAGKQAVLDGKRWASYPESPPPVFSS